MSHCANRKWFSSKFFPFGDERSSVDGLLIQYPSCLVEDYFV